MARLLAAVGLPVAILPRRRTFARLFAARTLTSLSIGIYRFALIWLVYVRTGSAMLLGGASAAMAVAALLAPAFGAIADRLPRRAILVATDTGCGLACLGLAGLAMLPRLVMPAAYALVFIVSALSMLDWTALNATVPQVVAAGELAEANGLWSAGMNLVEMGAPALAGAVVASTGPVAALLATMGLFAAAAGVVAGVAAPNGAVTPTTTNGAAPSGGAAPSDGTAPSQGAASWEGAAPPDGAAPSDGAAPR
ncbi:MAG TPA: MFS transporter, partial [Bacillota bacterium]|nr:MFS transporter [Bacillota bacterium]